MQQIILLQTWMNEQSSVAPGLEEEGDPGSRDDSRNSQRVRVGSEVHLQAVASG